uniref:FAD/NAD(P)-binding domain-containing protein n=1 Tax=Marmota marmota marmota TaxID=9994 RepID=A0A8C6EZ94_MARMA
EHLLWKVHPSHRECPTNDYDPIVIGGGSGGLLCAKEAAILGKKVMVLDCGLMAQGTSWGLGGCVPNVGCIPKKLMHQIALLGRALEDSRKFGWMCNQQVKHNWETMTEVIQNHMGFLLELRVVFEGKRCGLSYVDAYGEFVGHHKIKATNKKEQGTYFYASKFVIAMGEGHCT